MLFKDRLEVWNPGTLPPTLTLERLKGPHPSVPANPLIAEPMYLAKYIERMGTGIRDMIERCRAAGLGEPEFKIDGGLWITTIRRKPTGRDTTPEVLRMLGVVTGEMSRAEIMKALGLSDEKHFRERYLQVAIAAGLLEMTRPEAPQSPRQKYRIAERQITCQRQRAQEQMRDGWNPDRAPNNSMQLTALCAAADAGRSADHAQEDAAGVV